MPQTSEEFKKARNVIIELSNSARPENWIKWADSMEYTDKELLKFLSDVDSGNRKIDEIDSYMNQVSSSTAQFGSTLKTVAANMAIMIAINVAIKQDKIKPLNR